MVTMRPPFRLALRVLLVFFTLWGAWQIWYRVELRRYQQIVAPMFAEADKPLRDAASLVAEGDDASRYYSAAAIAELGDRPVDLTHPAVVRLVHRIRTAVTDGTTVSTRDAATAEQALTRSEVSMALAERGARLPFGHYAPGTMFSFRMSGLIGVHLALALRTIDAIRTGRADAAGAAIYSRLRLMRALEDQRGSFVPSGQKAGQMVELATDIGLWLALHPADAALQQVADALEEPYRRDELVSVLAMQARFVGGIETENADRAGVMAPLVLHRALPSMRATAAAIDAVRAPWPQRLDAVTRLSDRRQYVSLGAENMTISVALGIASNRAARLAIVAEQGRRLGDTTSPLARGRVSGDGSVDPFTGDPLHFVTQDAGFVAYSVGSNRTDDGGAVDLPLAVTQFLPASGRGPSTRPGADVGVRVRYSPRR